MRTFPGRNKDRVIGNTEQYANAAKRVAAAEAVPCVDLFNRFQEQPGWQQLLSDGLHLTPAGQRLFYEEAVAAIETAHPALVAADMPPRFPLHDAFTVETSAEELDKLVVPGSFKNGL